MFGFTSGAKTIGIICLVLCVFVNHRLAKKKRLNEESENTDDEEVRWILRKYIDMILKLHYVLYLLDEILKG